MSPISGAAVYKELIRFAHWKFPLRGRPGVQGRGFLAKGAVVLAEGRRQMAVTPDRMTEILLDVTLDRDGVDRTDEESVFRKELAAEVRAMKDDKPDSGTVQMTVTSDGKFGTLTRERGSFLDDGFAKNNHVKLSGFTCYQTAVHSVSDSTLTLWILDTALAGGSGKARVKAIGVGVDVPPE